MRLEAAVLNYHVEALVPLDSRSVDDLDVERAARGDEEACARVLRTMFPRVYKLVRYLVKDPNVADDLTQEAMVQILISFRSYRGEGVVDAWTRRIVTRVVFGALRRERERQVVPLHDAERVEDDAPPADSAAARHRTLSLLDRLPDDQRHALVLHYMLEMTIPEISECLSVPAETVRTRLRRGKARMLELAERRER